MKQIITVLFTFLFMFLATITLAQDISGQYKAEDEQGQMELILNQSDDIVTAQMTDGSKNATFKGTLQDDAILFDTTDFPFSIEAKLVEDTIEMIIDEDNASVENLNLSFERIEVREAARAPKNALSHLLQFVPARTESSIYTINAHYINLWALSGFRNAGVFQSQNDYLNFKDSEAYATYRTNSLMQSSTPFDSFSYYWGLDEMPATVGFSWFDIQASFNYRYYQKRDKNYKDERGYLAISSAKPSNISQALENINYEKQDFQGYPVWVNGDNKSYGHENYNGADPFSGDLGYSARVLLNENVISYARYNEVIDKQLDSYTQKTQSLAKAPDFAFLVSQLEATDDILFQANFPPMPHVIGSNGSWVMLSQLSQKREELLSDTPESTTDSSSDSNADPFLALENSIREEDKILFYAMANSRDKLPVPKQVALSHYFKDDSGYNKSYSTMSLLYAQKNAAQNASEILFERLSLYHQAFKTIDVQPAIITSSSSGNHHVVTVKVENVNQSVDAEGKQPMEPFKLWENRIYKGEFLPLYFF